MKKPNLFLFIGLLALLLGCSSADDGSFVDLEIQDALIFDNNENYSVGDTLYIELNFSRYLDEEGFSNKLDVFESSGIESFEYDDISLFKFSETENRFRIATIAPEFLFAEKGSIDDSGTVSVELNMETAQYESRIGVILQETGRFSFSGLEFLFLFDRFSGQISDEDRVRISIRHRFSGTPPNFEFTVSE
ncbi:hypothetical protein OAE12_01000 [bacterium]|nr:hypothetical protein [bacterium]